MSRSHPPTLLTIAARTIRDEALFGRGDLVLVAVSGGPDSMALLHVLARLRVKLGYDLVAHGVDHGLRAAAASELDLAEGLARTLDVPFARTVLRVAPGGNLQARARDARFEALRAAARSAARARRSPAAATRIATAHHAEDRAETVLLRLLRGSGPLGLAALAPRAGDLVRPLIRADRLSIDAHLGRHAIPHATDPSNLDPRFLRVRVRHELLPLLRDLSPSITAHLCALADQLGALRGEDPVDPYILALPRAARDALGKMLQSRSKKARVHLPGGLVASDDRPQLDGVPARATASRPRKSVGG